MLRISVQWGHNGEMGENTDATDRTDSTEHDPLALQNQVCFALSVTSRMVIGAYRDVLEPLNLTHPQYLVMLALWEHDSLSLKKLSTLLRQEPATLSPLTKRLETIGYITRAKDPDDERALHISLTDQGRQLRESALSVPPIMLERLGLSQEQFEHLNATLAQLLASMDDV